VIPAVPGWVLFLDQDLVFIVVGELDDFAGTSGQLEPVRVHLGEGILRFSRIEARVGESRRGGYEAK
jgi:hypothetical protein